MVHPRLPCLQGFANRCYDSQRIDDGWSKELILGLCLILMDKQIANEANCLSIKILQIYNLHSKTHGTCQWKNEIRIRMYVVSQKTSELKQTNV